MPRARAQQSRSSSGMSSNCRAPMARRQYSTKPMQHALQQYSGKTCCIGQYSADTVPRAHCIAMQQYSQCSNAAIHHNTVYNTIQSPSARGMDFYGGVEGHHRGHHQWLGERRFPFCAERAKNSAAAARAHRELLAREECSAMGSMDQKPRTIGKKGRIFSDSPSKSGFIKGI